VIGKPSNCATIHRRAIVRTVLNLSSAGTSQNYTNETSALQSITQSATIPVILQTKIFVLVVNRTAITCVCGNFTAYDTTSLRNYTDTQRQAQFTAGMDDDCGVPFVKLW